MRKTKGGPRKPRAAVPGAKALFKFRKANELTQAQVADRLGVRGPTVHDWETGAKRPKAHFRDVIEKWSDGAIPADFWKYPEEIAASNDVVPLHKTGTEGGR